MNYQCVCCNSAATKLYDASIDKYRVSLPICNSCFNKEKKTSARDMQLFKQQGDDISKEQFDVGLTIPGGTAITLSNVAPNDYAVQFGVGAGFCILLTFLGFAAYSFVDKE
jgi:hypothetical protein